MENTEPDPLTWGYWSSHESEGQAPAFDRGEAIAHRCLAFEHDNFKLLLHVIADIRDRGHFCEIERGFISLLARKARLGARPSDPHAMADHCMGEDRKRFVQGVKRAIAEMSRRDWTSPRDIVERIGSAIQTRDLSPEFAGYVAAIVASATACGGH